jgi:hypothetical protein
MVAWLNSLSMRERLFASIAGFSAMLFAGHIFADFLSADIKWGDTGAMGGCIVASVALVFGILGYLDNRKAQRFEYRAYHSFPAQRRQPHPEP